MTEIVAENRKKTWAEKLEESLNAASKAEAEQDFVKAEKLFREALFWEAKLRPDVSSCKAYIE